MPPHTNRDEEDEDQDHYRDSLMIPVFIDPTINTNDALKDEEYFHI